VNRSKFTKGDRIEDIREFETYDTVANKVNPRYPELEDFGEAHLIGNNGVTNFIRVDWLTPDASRTWGDGHTFILMRSLRSGLGG